MHRRIHVVADAVSVARNKDGIPYLRNSYGPEDKDVQVHREQPSQDRPNHFRFGRSNFEETKDWGHQERRNHDTGFESCLVGSQSLRCIAVRRNAQLEEEGREARFGVENEQVDSSFQGWLFVLSLLLRA